MNARRVGALALTAALGAVVLRRVLRSDQWRLLTMSGSSIASPTAAGWVTDFLNASYYARPRGLRSVDDLRLAFGILTTRWHRLGGRRLTAYDAIAFHRAFGRDRFVDAARSERGRLDSAQLREGARRLIGPWFADAWADPDRRGWGIAFETAGDKAAHLPERRLRNARLGPLTPPTAPGREQIWHTYPSVPVPSAQRVVEALTAVETWPDYGSEIGRFTPLRRRGLDGQTFEIEVIGLTSTRTPVLLRGYVTVTRLVTVGDEPELAAYVRDLNDAMTRFGRDEPPPVPEGAKPLVAFDLTTHDGHFLGDARNRLVLYEQDGQAYLRAASTWDPMKWHLDQVYSRAGRYEQHAFWGMESAEESMLHQIAQATARERAPA
ncbi:MAG: hypothetical protein GEU81_10455 [Nitriliruptorales bacterium]|nr:hypothetical protein [Nitriliruptorales bacterium]